MCLNAIKSGLGNHTSKNDAAASGVDADYFECKCDQCDDEMQKHGSARKFHHHACVCIYCTNLCDSCEDRKRVLNDTHRDADNWRKDAGTLVDTCFETSEILIDSILAVQEVMQHYRMPMSIRDIQMIVGVLSTEHFEKFQQILKKQLTAVTRQQALKKMLGQKYDIMLAVVEYEYGADNSFDSFGSFQSSVYSSVDDPVAGNGRDTAAPLIVSANSAHSEIGGTWQSAPHENDDMVTTQESNADAVGCSPSFAEERAIGDYQASSATDDNCHNNIDDVDMLPSENRGLEITQAMPPSVSRLPSIAQFAPNEGRSAPSNHDATIPPSLAMPSSFFADTHETTFTFGNEAGGGSTAFGLMDVKQEPLFGEHQTYDLDAMLNGAVHNRNEQQNAFNKAHQPNIQVREYRAGCANLHLDREKPFDISDYFSSST